MHIDNKIENIQELFSYLPKEAKQELIDYVEFLYFKYVKEKDKGNENKAFDIIKNYKGKVKKWTREELYDPSHFLSQRL